jgi:hypothetical protein
MTTVVMRSRLRTGRLFGWLHQRLRPGPDLRSCSGNDSALWDIIKISLVATVASLVLFVLGPRLIALGQTAVSQVQAPPW